MNDHATLNIISFLPLTLSLIWDDVETLVSSAIHFHPVFQSII